MSTGERLGPHTDEVQAARVSVHLLPLTRSARLLCRFRRLVRGGGYDVVHIHTERISTCYGVLARSAGAPRVVLEEPQCVVNARRRGACGNQATVPSLGTGVIDPHAPSPEGVS